MGFTLEAGIPALTVFLQGILSFFSPCVLPLVPLYIGYLSGGTRTVEADGTVRYQRKKVLLNTIFFVVGISFAFFLLGFSFTALGQFFNQWQTVFTRVGGILVLLFGLYQLGLFGQSRMLASERRFPLRLDKLTMGPWVALVLGFTFSFAWTPCVGPALASVLLLASSAASRGHGFVLIGVYTLGFVLPFLAVGLFTGSLLDFFKKHQKVVKYTVKAGGALMVLMGLMMFTGWMNGFSSYLSQFGAAPTPAPTAAADSAPSEAPGNPVAPDFTLTDQFGNEHTLSDYQGKTVFLNFWATWCGPCQDEMPDIQSLYEAWDENAGELIILGLARPNTTGNPLDKEGDAAHITAFLEENGYTYPVAMDAEGLAFYAYGISAFPTTFMISPDGTVFGYIAGGLTPDMMASIVRQTMDGTGA